MIICETARKPLLLFHLIHVYHVKNAIVFTKSAESTTRLVQLFKFFEASRTTDNEAPVVLSAYSSDLSPGDRKAVLDKFKSQEIHMCVVSVARRAALQIDDRVQQDSCARILFLAVSTSRMWSTS